MAPYLVIVLHIEYRKDLFEAQKLRAPLKTWDEWLDAAKRLTDRKANRFGFIMPLKTSYFASVLHASMLLSNGGHIIDAKGQVAFNSPQVVEMLRFTKRLTESCVPNAGELDIGDLQTLFYKEVAAMTWYSEVDIVPNVKKLNPNLKGKIGIMPIPARTAAQTPVLRMIAQYFSFGKGTTHRAEAKEYVKYLLRVDNQVKIMKSVPIANVPAIPAVKNHPDLWADPDIKEHRQLYLDYIDIADKNGRELAVQENPGVINPKTGQILGQNVLIQCIQDVVLKGVPPEKAAADWAKKMEAVVKS
jgi:multiple sugar transport system substrate-binding protein